MIGRFETFNTKINFALLEWPKDDRLKMVWWLPNDELIHRYYFCRANPVECGFKTFDRRDLEIHEQSCRVTSIDEGKQWWYRPRESDVNELIADGVLDEKFKDFTQNELVTFDIETQLMRTENQGNLVVPLSIAVSSTIDNDRYFERYSSDAIDGEKMVFEFLDYLESLYVKFQEK